ncbi:SRPBCC family protein [Nocardia sp. CDC153]|uniref:SRPBCC family protein n=1 Tax=Nocardia sp. CDC153 TaxID=3112167 RepID=UPI002DC032FF|nr:SRPBCC family protein [Nocardia sp. CDC153]MEC3953899.1 SRPBCC family protein [Nocardia sp. CDC153]
MTLISDPAELAGMVTREVRTGSRGGTPTRIAVARRTYPTDQGDLWDALTDAERIPRWFLPITGELAEGGRYQLEGQAGGVVERCDAPKVFAITWEFAGQVSWVKVSLSPAGDETELELEHEMPVDPQFWGQFGPGAVGVGWDLALLGLAAHIATGEPVDPEVGRTLHKTPEGKDFIRRAATSWGEAAITDGDDPDAARAAADATFAFYTVEPQDTPEPR